MPHSKGNSRGSRPPTPTVAGGADALSPIGPSGQQWLMASSEGVGSAEAPPRDCTEGAARCLTEDRLKSAYEGASPIPDLLAKASPDRGPVRYPVDHTAEALVSAEENGVFAQAKRMARTLHGWRVGLTIVDGDGSCQGSASGSSDTDAVVAQLYFAKAVQSHEDEDCARRGSATTAAASYTRHEVFRWEEDLQALQLSCCSDEQAAETVRRIAQAFTDAHVAEENLHTGDDLCLLPTSTTTDEVSDVDYVSLFLYQCEHLHELENMATRLVSEGACPPDTVCFAARDTERSFCLGDLNALLTRRRELAQQLRDWEKHLCEAKLQYPALSLLSGKRLGDFRVAFQGHDGGSNSSRSGAEQESGLCAVVARGRTKLVRFMKALLPRYARDENSNGGLTDAELTSMLTEMIERPQQEQGSLVVWPERLGVVLDRLMRSPVFSAPQPVPLDDGLKHKWAFPVLFKDEAVTDCVSIEPSDPSTANESDMIVLLLAVYLANFNRLPYTLEVLVCSPATTESDVQQFLDRWCAFSRHVEVRGRSGQESHGSSSSDKAAAYPMWCFSVVHPELLAGEVLRALQQRVRRHSGYSPVTPETATGGAVSQDDARRLVTPTLIIFSGRGTPSASARAMRGQLDRGVVSDLLPTLGAVSRVTRDSLRWVVPKLRALMAEEAMLGGAYTLAMGCCAAEHLCGGEDAVVRDHFARANPADHTDPMLYLRCALETEASTCAAMCRAVPEPLNQEPQDPSPVASILIRLDINPYVHPSEVNNALLSLFLSGCLGALGSGEVFVSRATDRFVIALPPPADAPSAAESGSSDGIAGSAVSHASQHLSHAAFYHYCARTQRFSSRDDWIARPLLPAPSVHPPERDTRRILLRAVRPAPPSEPVLQRVRILPDAVAKTAMQALLFALGCQAGVVPHFPLPDALDYFTAVKQLDPHFFYLSVDGDGVARAAATVLTPQTLFALLHRLLTAPETLPLTPSSTPTTAQAGVLLSQPPHAEWLPATLTEKEVGQVHRLYHHLVSALHAVLQSPLYSDTTNLMQHAAGAGSKTDVAARVNGHESVVRALSTDADPRITALPPSAAAEKARVLAQLQLTRWAILWEAARSVDVVRGRGRGAAAAAAERPLAFSPALRSCALSTDFGLRVGVASMLDEARLAETAVRGGGGGNPCKRDAEHVLAACGINEGDLEDSGPRWSSHQEYANVGGVTFEERHILSLMKDPMRLIQSTAVKPNFGVELENALAVIAAHLEEPVQQNSHGRSKGEAGGEHGGSELPLSNLPAYEDLLAVYAICIRHVRRRRGCGDSATGRQRWHDLRDCVECFLQHVRARRVLSDGEEADSALQFAFQEREPGFTLTPYLVRLMAVVTATWRAGEAVTLVGPVGAGKSAFAAYCASMSGLPSRSITCDRSMTEAAFLQRARSLIAEMRSDDSEGRRLLSEGRAPTATAACSDSEAAPRCVLVLHDVNRLRHLWLVKRVLVDGLLGAEVRLLATMSPHRTTGPGNASDLTVPLAQEVTEVTVVEFAGLTSPQRAVSRAFLRALTASADGSHDEELSRRVEAEEEKLMGAVRWTLLRDEDLIVAAAIEWLCEAVRWRTAECPEGASLGTILALGEGVGRTKLRLVQVLRTLLRAMREREDGAEIITRAAERGSSDHICVTVGLRAVWRWVHAFLFFTGCYCYTDAQRLGARKLTADEMLPMLAHGATLLSSCLHLPQKQRTALCASVLAAAGEQVCFFMDELASLMSQCTFFPGGIHDSQRMREMSLGIQLAVFHPWPQSVLVIGPPGAGKTLSFTSLEWASSGDEAKLRGGPYAPFVRRSLQCTPDTRPEDLEGIAHEVALADLRGCGRAVLEIDEVGRLVGSPHETQATLQRMLDEGVYVAELGRFHRLRVVAFSSTPVDDALMNRCTVIRSLTPDVTDYAETARVLASAHGVPNAAAASFAWEEFFRAFLAWWREEASAPAAASEGKAVPITHRDIYAVVHTAFYLLGLSRHPDTGAGGGCLDPSCDPRQHAFLLALVLNIGVCGSDSEAWLEDFRRLACVAVGGSRSSRNWSGASAVPATWHLNRERERHNDADSWSTTTLPNHLCEVCYAVLANSGGGGFEARYERRSSGHDAVDGQPVCPCLTSARWLLALVINGKTLRPKSGCGPRLRHAMVIGPPDRTWQQLHLQRQLQPTPEGRKLRVVMGQHDGHGVGSIAKDMSSVRAAIRDGSLLVLVHALYLSHYLNDVLNQNYFSVGARTFTMLNSNGRSERTCIHDDFRVCVLVDEEEYAQLEGPAKGRFVKFRPTFRDLLGDTVTQQVDRFYHRLRVDGGDDKSGADILRYLTPGLSAETLLYAFVAANAAVFRVIDVDSEVARRLFAAVLGAAVCPTRYLALEAAAASSEAPPNHATAATRKKLLDVFRTALAHKDDLPGAFTAYVQTIRTLLASAAKHEANPSPAVTAAVPRHVLVFTGQQPPLGMGDIHADLLAAAWWEAVRATTAGSSSAAVAPTRVLDLTRLSTVTLRSKLLAIHTLLAGSSQVLPIAFYLSAPLPDTANGADGTAEVAWKLQQFFVALAESGLAEETRLRMSVVVMLHPATLAIPPAFADQVTARSAAGQASIPAAWAVLHVDEVYPCEWGALHVLRRRSFLTAPSSDHMSNAAEDELPSVDAQGYQQPVFHLRELDVVGGVVSPVRCLSQHRDMLVSIMQMNAAAVAQELEDFTGSAVAVCEWCAALHSLFASAPSASAAAAVGALTNPLGVVLVDYMQAIFQRQVERDGKGHLDTIANFAQPLSTGKSGRSRSHPGTAVGPRTVAGAVGGIRSDSGVGSLRSQFFARTQRVATNAVLHVLALLFPSSSAMQQACKEACFADSLHCRFTRFFLRKCGPNGGLLPLDELTSLSPVRLVSMRDLRYRQPFLCRAPAGRSGEPQLPSRLPFSYTIHRLLLERLTPGGSWSPGPTREEPAGSHGRRRQSLLHMLDREESAAFVDAYAYDAVLFFLEGTVALTVENYNDDVLWCLLALMDTRVNSDDGGSRGADAVRGASHADWGKSLGSTAAFLADRFVNETKWVLNAHAYCALVVQENKSYVAYLRRICPRGVLAARFRPPLFRDVTDFYKRMTFSEPIEGADGIAPAPRLRSTPQELVSLRALSPYDHRTRWDIDVQRLSYALLSAEEEQQAVDEEKLAVVESLLRCGSASPHAMCDWLHGQLRHSSGSAVTIPLRWLHAEVAPLVVAHLCRFTNTPGGEQSVDTLPADDAVAAKLLVALVDDGTGALHGPPRTVFSLAKALLMRWLAAYSAATTTAAESVTAGAVHSSTALPLISLAAPIGACFGNELTRLLVLAAVQCLAAQLSHEDGNVSCESPGATSTATDRYEHRTDVRVRDQLWGLLVATWDAHHDRHKGSPYHLALAIAIAVLQVEMECVRTLLLRTAVVNTGAEGDAAVRCSSSPEQEPTIQSKAVDEALRGLAEKLWRFQQEWGAVLSSDMRASGRDDKHLHFAIYVLLLRVLSCNGLDLPTARTFFPKILAAARCQPDFSDSLVLSQLTSSAETKSVLAVVLNNTFVGKADSVPLPEPEQVVLLRSVRYLTHLLSAHEHGPPPALPQCGTRYHAVCVAFEAWQRRLTDGPGAALAADRWADKEVQQTLAAIALYLSMGDCGSTPSALRRILEGTDEALVSVVQTVAAPPSSALDLQATQAAVVAHAVTAVAAFLSGLLRGQQLFFRDLKEKAFADELVVRLLPSCPKCHEGFSDFAGCCALNCGSAQCGTWFCAWCLTESGSSHRVHAHVAQCPCSLNPGQLFSKREKWFEGYLLKVFPKRLEALTARKELSCAILPDRPQPFVAGLLEEEERLLARMGPAEMEYVRYKAYQAVTTLGFGLDVGYQLIGSELRTAAAWLRPAKLIGYEVTSQVLVDALAQVKAVFFSKGGSARLQSNAVLKFLLALLVSYGANRETHPATAAFFQLVVGHVNVGAMLSQLDAAVEAGDRAAELPDLAAWGPGYAQVVLNAVAAHDADAMLPFLFRPFLNDPGVGADALSRLGSACGLQRLQRFRDSFSAEAAVRLERVLDFALDARRVVRRDFVSKQRVVAAKLAYLTDHYPGLFPRNRVAAFVAGCRELLTVLSRADNRCHAGQNFTLADSDDAAAISLAEAVGLDEGNLLNLLYTGSDAVGDNEPRHVGYGNAENGQTRVLEGLHLDVSGLQVLPTAFVERQRRRQGQWSGDRVFLLRAAVDLIQYDRSVPLQLMNLVGEAPDTTPGLRVDPRHGGSEGEDWDGAWWRHTSSEKHTLATISRAVLCSAGCLARSELPTALPELELDTPGISGLLGGAEEWVACMLQPLQRDAGAGRSEDEKPSAKADGDSFHAAVCAPPHSEAGWYTRAELLLSRLTLARAATDDHRHDIFRFLVEYARFAQRHICSHDFAAAASSAASQLQRNPLPSFDQVPVMQLTSGQQAAQAGLCEARARAEDAPVLLLAAFQPEYLPYSDYNVDSGEGMEAVANEGGTWTDEQEAQAVQTALASLSSLGSVYQSVVVAAVKMVLLHTDLLGLETAGKTLADVIQRVCLDGELAELLGALVGAEAHYSSLPALLKEVAAKLR